MRISILDDYFETMRTLACLRMKRLSLAVALAGVLALGASPTAAHWRATKRLAVHRCIEVSQPARGCPLRHYSLLPWPGIPRCYLYGGVCVYHTASDWEEWGYW
jgi:hypothetical protein